uniref:UCH domain-containing protein n=1 Tax=Macrostomum lignano TaxID=282301 RepID=A0A1I8IGC7_9PLAT
VAGAAAVPGPGRPSGRVAGAAAPPAALGDAGGTGRAAGRAEPAVPGPDGAAGLRAAGVRALQLADLLSSGCRQGLLSGGGVLLFKDWRALLSAPKKCSTLRTQLEAMRSEYRQAGPERLSELFDHLLAELAGLDNRQRPSGGGASGGFRVSARWEKRAKKAARRAGLAVRLLRSVRGESRRLRSFG